MSLVEAANLSELDIIGRLAASLAVGAALGLERELDGQEAGLRTHALLALGAGMFGVLSVGAFGDFASDTAGGNVQIDVTRIASYVAAGVGFLAGGAIVKEGTRVKGLTTAASLWVCAAVGLAAGLGFYVGAITATVGALLMLVLERPMLRLRRSKELVAMAVQLRDHRDVGGLIDALYDEPEPNFHPHITSRERPDGSIEVEIRQVRLPTARRLLAKVATMPTVVQASLLSD